jgi:hypothetical protein
LLTVHCGINNSVSKEQYEDVNEGHYKWNTHTTLSNFFVKVWPTTVLPIKIRTRWEKTKTCKEPGQVLVWQISLLLFPNYGLH